MAERRLAHGAIDQRIVDAIELEGEEQEMRGRRGDALLHVAIELGARRMGGVARIDEARKRNEPAEEIVDRLVTFHRFGERTARIGAPDDFTELALVRLREGRALDVRPVEIA